MNRTSWERILKKYSEALGLGNHNRIQKRGDSVSGVIKEIDEDFLVLENKDGSEIVAVVELNEVAGFRTC